MTVVRTVWALLCQDGRYDNGTVHGLVESYLRRQPGMTEPDAPIPTPMELESLLERIGEE